MYSRGNIIKKQFNLLQLVFSFVVLVIPSITYDNNILTKGNTEIWEHGNNARTESDGARNMNKAGRKQANC